MTVSRRNLKFGLLWFKNMDALGSGRNPSLGKCFSNWSDFTGVSSAIYIINFKGSISIIWKILVQKVSSFPFDI